MRTGQREKQREPSKTKVRKVKAEIKVGVMEKSILQRSKWHVRKEQSFFTQDTSNEREICETHDSSS